MLSRTGSLGGMDMSQTVNRRVFEGNIPPEPDSLVWGLHAHLGPHT